MSWFVIIRSGGVLKHSLALGILYASLGPERRDREFYANQPKQSVRLLALGGSEFLSRAWKAANDKARELGWIV